MKRALFAVSVLLGLSCTAACKPNLGSSASLVTEERVLAVRAARPELQPGAATELSALVASPSGTIERALGWSFCTAPKPLDENNSVADACLGASALLPIADQPGAVSATVPLDACQRFGPDPPPQQPGQPPLRPRDPDVSGGFYQPIRVERDGELTFASLRIVCNLPSASPEVAQAFRAQYVANQNPTIAAVSATLDGQPVALDHLPHDRDVVLRVDFAPDAAEDYLAFSLETHQLEKRRESLRVSWFGESGAFALDRSGRDEADDEPFVENTWHTPSPGPHTLWLVLRDARGGLDFRSVAVVVE